jgi:hypothetical protein
VLTSRCGNYLLVLVQQRRQPIHFLDPRVEFPILLGEIVRLPLNRRNTNRTDELYFGACRATLSGRGHSRKFAVCVVADLQNVPFGKGVSQRSVAESRSCRQNSLASRFRRFLARDLRKARRRYRHSLQGHPAAFRKGLSVRACRSLIPGRWIGLKNSSTNT